MDSNETTIKHNPVKIPDRQQVYQVGVDTMLQKNNATPSASVDSGLFYEIEYDSHPIKGVGRFVLRPQKIEPQEKDEIREQFYAMRDISRNHRSYHGYNKFYDKRVQQDNAAIFYKQGVFMKDFTDNCSNNAPFSSYFPNYHMMSYDQLRTYFTWRTNVRGGNVADISISYVFLYIYELLNNIGVKNPHDGLKKLMLFWRTFREFNKTIDKYVISWLKDYHIYYELPHSFKEFAEENDLSEHYPKMMEMADEDDCFDLFCAISKYDIRKSAFFTEENIKLISDCFNFVIEKIEEVFSWNGLHFENSIFAPTKKMSPWQPFRSALFYLWLKQPDRRIVLSQNEIYVCKQNKWESSTVITSESGRQLIGYIMKKMEAELRNLTKYKYKISANVNMITHPIIEKLKSSGLSLGNIITSAVMEFYREATKIIVSVDYSSLIKIRQEARSTQAKLSVDQVEDRAVHAADSGNVIVEDTAIPVIKGNAVSSSVDVAIPSSMDVAAPSAVDVDIPSSMDVAAPSAVDVVIPSAMDVAAPSRVDVAIPSSMDVAAPSAVDVDIPSAINVAAPFKWDVVVSSDGDAAPFAGEDIVDSAKESTIFPIVKDATVPVIEGIAVTAVNDILAPVAEDAVVSVAVEIIGNRPHLVPDPWENFNNSIFDTEKQALIILLSKKQAIKQFADDNGIMLEVLIDGINEKAIDFIGDNIIDEDFNIYDDYMEKVKKMVDEYE